MERTQSTKRFTLLHAAGLLLILCTAIAVFFGIHPRYRILSGVMIVLGALAAWKRAWMFWIVVLVQAMFAAFLWLFPQAGYRIASVVPLAIISMLLVFRFCKKPVKIAASVVLALGAALLIAAEIPIVSAAVQKPGADAQYVIVLGAAVYGETPSVTLEHRLEGAMRCLGAIPEAKAVVSGGQGAGEDISEAECMRRYLSKHGIASERILIEDRSTSTKENLAFSKAVIEADGGTTDRVVIVSSGYHLYRAQKTAEQLGMRAGGAAGADGYPIYMFGMYLREAAAVWKLWVFGA